MPKMIGNIPKKYPYVRKNIRIFSIIPNI